jgi:hypothetical protein
MQLSQFSILSQRRKSIIFNVAMLKWLTGFFFFFFPKQIGEGKQGIKKLKNG